MVQKEVSAKVPANEEKGIEEMSAVVYVNFAETIDEAVEMFGEEAILTNAFRNWAVTLQSNIRTKLKSGLSPEQVADALKTAVMGVAQVGTRVDPQTAFIAKFKMATPEEQATMLAKLREAAGE